MIVLGVDPGKATTGWGVLRYEPEGKKKKCLDYGVIRTDSDSGDPERLRVIFNRVNRLMREYEPDRVAAETLYFFKNKKTALGVAQARGVVLLSAARKRTPVTGYTPLQVKMAICGYGRAEKKQIQKMVKELLSLDKIPRPDDAADALAVAICETRASSLEK